MMLKNEEGNKNKKTCFMPIQNSDHKPYFVAGRREGGVRQSRQSYWYDVLQKWEQRKNYKDF